MNDSVLVWGGVLVLVLIAVILYCLFRLLTRRPGAPVTGGVTVDTVADAPGPAPSVTGDPPPGLTGADLDSARGRARAAARHHVRHRAPEAAPANVVPRDVGSTRSGTSGSATAAGPPAAGHPVAGHPVAGPTTTDWDMPSAGVGPTPVPAGYDSPGPASGPHVDTTHHDDPRS